MNEGPPLCSVRGLGVLGGARVGREVFEEAQDLFDGVGVTGVPKCGQSVFPSGSRLVELLLLLQGGAEVIPCLGFAVAVAEIAADALVLLVGGTAR